MNQENSTQKLRHSAAHLLAHAIIDLFPSTKLTIGPATDEGFFYDVLPEKHFKEEDLPKIWHRMQEIVDANFPLEHKEIAKEEARKLYKDNTFKLELIDQIPGNTVGLAIQGPFYDLCKGGHVQSTGLLKHCKLLSLAGSYWRADKTKQALQRIYGTVFFTAEELHEFERRREELTRYDHRTLGKQLELFSFHEEGVGFPFFHPKGQRVINTMKQYMRHMQAAHNYQEISTPTMLSDELWKRSGHYAHYRDKMYISVIDDQAYAIKPMNCPGAILTYQTRPRSYRELPLKLSEFGHVHRHELSGVLHGLMRVRAFTQDDAHIFCKPEQLEQEVNIILQLTMRMLNDFGFDKKFIAVATQPANSMGDATLWQQATAALTNALEKANLPYTVKEGEGAFYGPKIDLDIEDSMGRRWQCGTVQIDFFLPENFELGYIAPSGKKERPVIIHQAIYGSLERFFAILLEHHKGNLPFWLAPIQARIMTITDTQKEYAQQVLQAMQKAHIRADLADVSDPIQAKIKTAQLERIPWMIILGKREAEEQTITLRHRDGSQIQGTSLDTIIARAYEEQKILF